jgi:hypothetical protein
MRIGQRVRIVRVPENVIDQPEFPTRTLLTKCLGRISPVKDVQLLYDEKGKLKDELLALDVGAVNGKTNTESDPRGMRSALLGRKWISHTRSQVPLRAPNLTLTLPSKSMTVPERRFPQGAA